jgi:hypothetical protein
MALKCVTCGLLFRNRNELDWHVREEHLERRLPPAKDQPGAPRLHQALVFPIQSVPEEKDT